MTGGSGPFIYECWKSKPVSDIVMASVEIAISKEMFVLILILRQSSASWSSQQNEVDEETKSDS